MTSTDTDDRSNLTDEERSALEGEDAGSLADAEVAARAAEAEDDAEGAPAPDAEDPPAGDAPPVAAADETRDEFDQAALRLMPPPTHGVQEEVAQLLDQRKTLREQYRNGDISAEDKDKAEDELNDRISDLRAEQKQAAFVENYNQQMAEREYLQTIARVKADIRDKEGIDYDKDPMMLQALDLRVRTLAADPANAERSGEWFLREAHRQVAAGIESAAKALGFVKGDGRPPPPPSDPLRDAVRSRRPAETRAKSLAALPAAASDSGHAGAEFAGLDSLNGDALEMAVARMTPEQQERWAQQ